MGLLTALGQAPLLVFGLLAGGWVDRASRRRLLIACDLGRAIVLAFVPIAAVVGFLTLPLLVAVVFAAAAMGVLFGTAAPAFLPDLVRRDQLLDANAKLTQPRAFAQIAGPGLAGALVQAVTAPVALVLDVLSYLASAALLGRISAPGPHRQLERAERPAMLLAAAGPGALLEAALAVPASRRLGVGPVMIARLVAAGVTGLVVPLAAGAHLVVFATLVIAMFVNGLGQPLYNINQAGLRQAIVPAAMQGRVQAS